jgi:hypothetical protein
VAGVICASCGTANLDGEALCKTCGTLLGEPGTEFPPPPSPAVAPQTPAAPAPDTCPACEADVPDPANLVCVECLEPLTRRTKAPQQLETRREAPAPVRLVFRGQPVEVSPPGPLLLGRDPGLSPVAALFGAHDNVSRRHASVGVRPDGSVWVRDERSANGTFVNDARVPAGATVPLVDGDRLRLASDIVVQVRIGSAPCARRGPSGSPG